MRAKMMTMLIGASLVCASESIAQQRPASYYNPKWSPDGRTLVFESTRDGNSSIFSVGLDGSRLSKLTNDPFETGQPSWSPDGRRIVYSTNRDGSGQLWVMNADGTNQIRLTTEPRTGGKYQASFSPDGQWIVFQGRTNNALVNENVYVMHADGSGLRRLTDTTLNSLGPRWTKDGRITFVQNRYDVQLWSQMTRAEKERGEKNEEIITMRPDGSGVTRARKPVDERCCESWTADWSTRFFVATRDAAEAVYASNADGTDVRRIAPASSIPDPNVSPDGRLFAYERNTGDARGIYVYDIATGRERQVAGGGKP